MNYSIDGRVVPTVNGFKEYDNKGKGNPYHDKLGRFTTGPSGFSRGQNVEMTTAYGEKLGVKIVRKLDEKEKQDRAHLANPDVDYYEVETPYGGKTVVWEGRLKQVDAKVDKKKEFEKDTKELDKLEEEMDKFWSEDPSSPVYYAKRYMIDKLGVDYGSGTSDRGFYERLTPKQRKKVDSDAKEYVKRYKEFRKLQDKWRKLRDEVGETPTREDYEAAISKSQYRRLDRAGL